MSGGLVIKTACQNQGLRTKLDRMGPSSRRNSTWPLQPTVVRPSRGGVKHGSASLWPVAPIPILRFHMCAAVTQVLVRNRRCVFPVMRLLTGLRTHHEGTFRFVRSTCHRAPRWLKVSAVRHLGSEAAVSFPAGIACPCALSITREALHRGIGFVTEPLFVVTVLSFALSRQPETVQIASAAAQSKRGVP